MRAGSIGAAVAGAAPLVLAASRCRLRMVVPPIAPWRAGAKRAEARREKPPHRRWVAAEGPGVDGTARRDRRGLRPTTPRVHGGRPRRLSTIGGGGGRPRDRVPWSASSRMRRSSGIREPLFATRPHAVACPCQAHAEWRRSAQRKRAAARLLPPFSTRPPRPWVEEQGERSGPDGGRQVALRLDRRRACPGWHGSLPPARSSLGLPLSRRRRPRRGVVRAGPRAGGRPKASFARATGAAPSSRSGGGARGDRTGRIERPPEPGFDAIENAQPFHRFARSASKSREATERDARARRDGRARPLRESARAAARSTGRLPMPAKRWSRARTRAQGSASDPTYRGICPAFPATFRSAACRERCRRACHRLAPVDDGLSVLAPPVLEPEHRGRERASCCAFQDREAGGEPRGATIAAPSACSARVAAARRWRRRGAQIARVVLSGRAWIARGGGRQDTRRQRTEAAEISAFAPRIGYRIAGDVGERAVAKSGRRRLARTPRGRPTGEKDADEEQSPSHRHGALSMPQTG